MTRRRTAAGGPLASKGVISAKLLANAVVTVEAMNTEARIRLTHCQCAVQKEVDDPTRRCALWSSTRRANPHFLVGSTPASQCNGFRGPIRKRSKLM